MDRERLTIRPHRGPPLQVEAVLARTSPGRRLARSAAWAVGGGLVGLLAVVIPPHGVWTLGIWALSGALAWFLWDRTVAIAELTGECSACEAKLTLKDVGPWSSDLWVRCPSCQAPYRVDRPSGSR